MFSRNWFRYYSEGGVNVKRKDLKMIQPLVIVYGHPKNLNQMTFLGYDKEITVEGCSEVLNKLLPLCNGVNRLEDILKGLEDEYEIESLMEVIKILLENEILIDSREFYWIFHKRSMNPSLYFNDLSEKEVMELFKKRNYKIYPTRKRLALSPLSTINSGFLEFTMLRKSTRVYSSQNVSFDKLSGLLKAAYGITRIEFIESAGILYKVPHRTIPSGGGLSPLEVYVLTLINIEPLRKGLYCFNKEKEYLTLVKKGDFRNKLKEMLFEVNEAINTASLFLVITANFFRECEKYSNRGYRHILLEAGHLAQNVYLYCIDQNLDTVELSAFWDEELAKFLEIDTRKEAPIILLAIGSR